jgi:DNA-binding MarR family transcriptional regulator
MRPPSEGLAAGLLIAGHRLGRLLDAELAPLGLSAAEAMVLRELQRTPLTMSGVMRVLSITASTATSLVTRLEKRGHVHRRVNPDDARSFLVDPTEVGRRLSTQAADAFARVDALLGAADPRGVSRLGAVLAVLDQAATPSPAGAAPPGA